MGKEVKIVLTRKDVLISGEEIIQMMKLPANVIIKCGCLGFSPDGSGKRIMITRDVDLGGGGGGG